MKRTISAEIVADSLNEFGDRIITYVLQYPRFIHAELLTHRMFSRNSASSRAIPFKKMVKLVKEDPFIPIAWQKSHKGMQGTKYYNPNKSFGIDEYISSLQKIFGFDKELAQVYENQLIRKYAGQGYTLKEWWLKCRDSVIECSLLMGIFGVTKQLCNRLLEPFQWYKVIVTATEYDNFFELRCPKYFDRFKSKKDLLNRETEEYYPKFDDGEATQFDWYSINKSGAEIHIQALAEAMWDARNESKPKQLKAGEWHIPFGNKFDEDRITEVIKSECKLVPMKEVDKVNAQWLRNQIKVKIATARCARISYNNFEGKDDYEADIKLYNRLESMKHASPFEHCAVAMSGKEYEEYHKGRLELDFFQGSDHEFEGYFYDPDITDKYIKCYHGWCRNFKGFINLRHKINL